MKNLHGKHSKRGAALITTFGVMTALSIAAVSFINSSTMSIRNARRQALDLQSTHLCEAGVQTVLRSLWRPFKITQNFSDLDARCNGSAENNPSIPLSGSISGVGNYSAGVIAVSSPNNDSYTRQVTVRAVSWIDLNGNGTMDDSEPQKVVDVTATYTLDRSQVFDYTYFVNNYGWMDGFGPNDLIVNGDMRANGDFKITNGSPTINGSLVAAVNDKLSPAAAGLVNQAPVKWANDTYKTNAASNSGNASDNQKRWRQAYDASVHGAKGTTSYDAWRDFLFDTTGGVVNNKISGAIVGDSLGTRSWGRTDVNSAATTSMIDSNPTQEVIMPDLSDLSYYQNLSSIYRDAKPTFLDGTANPNYNVGSYVDSWNSTTGKYDRITTNGVVTGSAILVGSAAHPLLVHGPVTFTQDAVITGNVSGQGTIYTGRNVHIVGSIIYTNKPNFRGTDQATIDKVNERADMVALAARGSVIMGDTSTFSDSYPLQYMTPPFTKGRYDESGNWIAAFDAKAADGSGVMRYKSVLGQSAIHAVASSVNQIDAVLYTNFVGGGNIGTGGGGVVFNGSIISKDEAMVVWSIPMRMNYDSRIRERNISSTPLIDLSLPRSPVMLRSAWQDRGFKFGTTST